MKTDHGTTGNTGMNMAGKYAESFFHKDFSSFIPALPVFPVVFLLNTRLSYVSRGRPAMAYGFSIGNQSRDAFGQRRDRARRVEAYGFRDDCAVSHEKIRIAEDLAAVINHTPGRIHAHVAAA
jgi:hypothetical protein